MGDGPEPFGFFGRYLGRLRESLARRRKADFPDVGRFTMVLILAVAAYIVLSLLLVPTGSSRELNFVSERGSVTALSGVFLGAGAACAFLSFFIQYGRRAHDQGLWLLVTAALGFLALDELLMFHERVDSLLGERASTLPVLAAFRNLNDVVVIAYGIVAVPFLVCLFPALLRYPKLAEVFAVAFSFYLLHTLIDSTQEPPTTYSIIAEESAKLFSTAFLAFGSFIGTVGIVWNHPVKKSASN